MMIDNMMSTVDILFIMHRLLSSLTNCECQSISPIGYRLWAMGNGQWAMGNGKRQHWMFAFDVFFPLSLGHSASEA